MKVIIAAAIMLTFLGGGIYGFQFILKDLRSMYHYPKQRSDDETEDNSP